MELIFTKSSNGYIADFSASTPFNIHIERDGGRVLSVSRRTVGEGWGTIEIIRQGRVIDADVYNDIEREFRIQSDVEPTMCEITFGTTVAPDVPTENEGSGEITFTVNTISLTSGIPVGTHEMKATEGMTWYEWCQSEYNVFGLTCDDESYEVYTFYYEEDWMSEWGLLRNAEGGLVYGRDKIVANAIYSENVDGYGVGGGGGSAN